MANPFIHKLATLEPLTERHRRKLEQLTLWTHSFKPHTSIVQQGCSSPVVNIVLSGWACRYKLLPDGRRQIIALFLPGDMCDAYVSPLAVMNHSIGTLTSSVIAQMPAQDVHNLLLDDPELAGALWRQTQLAVEIQREWTVSLGRRTALERLAHLFCEILTRLALIDLSNGVECDCPLTQTDLADILGLSTVHVNRSMQQLRADRLVELRGKRLAILDRRALEEIAMFDPVYLHPRAL